MNLKFFAPARPELYENYYNRKPDERDMIDHVVPRKIDGDVVTYWEVYKDRSQKSMKYSCSIREFNRHFRKG